MYVAFAWVMLRWMTGDAIFLEVGDVWVVECEVVQCEVVRLRDKNGKVSSI